MRRRHTGSNIRGQDGIALLVFMLVLLVGSSYMLISKLNEYAQTYARDEQTRIALLKAKRALLNYAMNYPELKGTSTVRGPGYLPCPDENDDGTQETNCSVTTGSTLGRLPTQTLGLGDLRDSSGERLWYAVSQNFEYNQDADYVLNSETPGTICVDGTGTSCVGGTGDVVAVIIAPGPPLTGQTDRQPTPETTWLASNGLDLYQVAGEYLEDDNATTGDASYVTSSSSGNEFNDQLVTITRAELMQYVQKRVLAEARNALMKYKQATGAYPWLLPFGDPKADTRWVTGEHSGSNGSSSLVDSSADFTDWGVSPGDVVWNVTDGSVATVTGVSATPEPTLTLSGLSGGTNNDFNTGDEYVVEQNNLASALAGIATSGSSGDKLVVSGKNFAAPLVMPGDIVENTSNDSSWRVESVDGDTITVANSSGTTSAFSQTNAYRIRSDTGAAASGSAGLTLTDANADFSAMGVRAGDLVTDITDGSFGEVSRVTGTNTLTVSDLNMGASNAFDAGHVYSISRNADISGIADSGSSGDTLGDDHADFQSMCVQPGDTIIDTTDKSHGSVASVLDAHTLTVSGLQSGSSNAFSDGDAYSIFRVRSLVGSATSGSANLTLEDTGKDFKALCVQPGDFVRDTTDGSYGRVAVVTGTHELTVSNLRFGTINGFTDGDQYTITTGTEGLLPLREPGEAFSTGFKLDWTASGANVTGGTDPAYTNAITALAESSANYNTTVSVSSINGECTWVEKTIADCRGILSDVLQGAAQSWSGSVLYDSNMEFAAQGVKRGDRIANLATGTQGIVTSAVSGQVSVSSISGCGYTAFTIGNGQNYRVQTATDSVSGSLINLFGINYALGDLSSVSGDSPCVDVVVNTSQGNAVGLLTSITTVIPTVLYQFTYTSLKGGLSSIIAVGDSFSIHSNFAQRRDIQFHVRMKGNEADSSSSGVRTRTVCSGYDSTCITASSAAFPYNSIDPQISVLDYDSLTSTSSSDVIGEATVPDSSSATGSMRISGMLYPLVVDDDFPLPEWFAKNRWQRLLYITYSSLYGPGGAGGTCTAGTNCLQINVQVPPSTLSTGQALVLAAGPQLDSQPEDRTTGHLDAYLESGNASGGDGDFDKKEITTTFNDQIGIICPDLRPSSAVTHYTCP